MYLADTTVLSKNKNPDVYERMEQDLLLSKNLYNAALFRIRQVFTGWERSGRRMKRRYSGNCVPCRRHTRR